MINKKKTDTVGGRVKELRIDNRLTQQELAQILKISQSTLALYESNKRNIPNDVMIKIAQSFEVSADYLLGLKEF